MPDQPHRAEVVYVKNEGLPAKINGDAKRRWVVVQSEVLEGSSHTILVKITTTPQVGQKGVQIPDGEAGLKNSWADCGVIVSVHLDFVEREPIKSRQYLPNRTTMRKIEKAMRFTLDAKCEEDS